MTEPLVVDIRAGITQAVLDGLASAERVVIAVKNRDTAALGYWTDDRWTIGLMACSLVRLMYVPQRVEWSYGAAPAEFREPRVMPALGVQLDLRSPRTNTFLRRLLGLVQAGDVLRLASDAESPRLATLEVLSKGVRVASLRLPRRSPPRRSAA